ncbi:MAG: hypothetical protein WAZ48_00230 [Lysobacteraceae bacterium]
MPRFIAHSGQAQSAINFTLTLTGSEGKYTGLFSPSLIPMAPGSSTVTVTLVNQTDGTAAFKNYASTGFIGGKSPIASFKARNGSFNLTLQDHQIVDFGYLVCITFNGAPYYIFCDPQASNDPIQGCPI